MKLSYLLLLLFALSACFKEKYKLGLFLTEGETYSQHMSSTVSMDQSYQGQSIKLDMLVEGDIDYKVLSISKKVYTMEVNYRRLSMNMQTPYGMVSFTTDTATEDTVFSPIFRTLINKPFTITMDQQGKVLDVKGLDNIFGGMFNKFPNLSETERAQIKKQLEDAYGADAIRGNMEMSTYIYGADAVAIGDSWLINTTLSGGMKADMETTYSLVSVEKGNKVIKGESKIETDPEAIIEQPNGMKMRHELKGIMTSTLTVDSLSGWIVKAEISQDISGTTHVESSMEMPDGMEVPMTMKTKMTITN